MTFGGTADSALDTSVWNFEVESHIKAELLGGFKFDAGGNLSFSVPCARRAVLRDAYINIEVRRVAVQACDPGLMKANLLSSFKL